MTVLTEGQRAGEFIVSESNGTRSRETVTVITGQNLKAGAVVGKITASGKYTELDTAAATGEEAAAAILYGNCDATDADKTAVVITRDAEVNGNELVWPDGILTADKNTAIAELKALGIIVR